MLQEFGFGESQFLKFGDFGAFKERLRSVAIEEIGQAGSNTELIGPSTNMNRGSAVLS